MWEVKNLTEFSSENSFERDKHGKEFYIVAVVAEFEFANGGLPSRIDVDDPKLEPEFAGKDSEILICECDFNGFRPATDITVSGTVGFSSRNDALVGRPLSMSVGPLSKSLHCAGARSYVSRPRARFDLLDNWETGTQLCWSNSAGGFVLDSEEEVLHPTNPGGCGWWIGQLADLENKQPIALPSLEPIDQKIFNKNSRCPGPIGFGPISRGHPDRLKFAGTYDQDWLDNRSPLLPLDFEERFYNAAPLDQIFPGYIKGGEKVRLEGFWADGSIHEFRLPQIILEAKNRIGRSQS